MKKKKLLVLLLMVISFFGIKINVKAITKSEMKSKIDEIYNDANLGYGKCYGFSRYYHGYSCYAFANEAASRIFGSSHYEDYYGTVWEDTGNIWDVHAGDVVIYYEGDSSSGEHAILVVQVKGNSVILADSNRNGNGCNSWFLETNKSDLSAKGIKNVWHFKGNNIYDPFEADPEPTPFVPSGTKQNLGTKFTAYIVPTKATNLAVASGTVFSNGKQLMLKNKVLTGSNKDYQLWNFIRKSDGSYSIQSYINKNYYMDIANNGYNNGEIVQLWYYNTTAGSTGDKNNWYIYNYNGGYRLVPKSSDNKYKHALDVTNGSLTENSKMEIYEALTSTNKAQTFNVEKVLDSIKLNSTSVSLNIGDTYTLTTTKTPTDAIDTLTWTSSNTSVATVSNGKITAKKAGTATITVSGINVKATTTVTVKNPVEVSSIEFDRTTMTIQKGSTGTIVAKVLPSTATNKTLTWTSGNTSIATVDQTGKVTAKNYGTVTITAKSNNGKTVTCKVTVPKPGVSYTTHVQSYGWQKYVSDGAMAGTQGEAKRLEAIKIKLTNAPYSGNVEYKTHIQTYGWETSFKKNDAESGTSGQAKRLEAIQIKLTGTMATYYDIYYRVHAQKFGWLGWAKNGESSGTSGYAYRLEGIEIKLVEKGTSFSDYGKLDAYKKRMVNYTTHVQSYGWQDYTFDGNMSGTSGEAKRLEAIKIELDKPEYTGNILYRTHIQSYGWEKEFKKNGEMSGTSGEAKRLEAIQIKLDGKMATYYDVYYRVHAQHFGWLAWAKNGASAGTAGYAYRLEGIEIVLVKKGQKPPTRTDQNNTKAFISK